MPDATASKPAASSRRRHIWPWALGVVLLVVLVALLLFRWDWLIPLVESQVKTATGRSVTLTHLHVRLGRTTHIVADDVQVLNPDGFPQDKQLGDRFATLAHLGLDVNLLDYVLHQRLVVPVITLDHLQAAAVATTAGKTNYSFIPPGAANAPPPKTAPKASAGPQLGLLEIIDGHAHVVQPKLKADFQLALSTKDADRAHQAQLVIDGHGRYAEAPITLGFLGGAVLSLRDTRNPYPIDLRIENGPTKVTVKGTVQNPLNFAGARIRLSLAGPDMSLLYPLTAIPIPKTPPYALSGDLDYTRAAIRFSNFDGRVGSSDLEGMIAVEPHGAGAGDTATGGRPVVTANLASRNVDITDLGGFIGAQPGKSDTPGQPPTQKQTGVKAAASDNLLPTAPINLPKIKAADVHLTYRGQHITNKFVPLDNIVVALDVEDGRIDLHPLDFGVGTGRIVSNLDLVPVSDGLHTKADFEFQRLDLSRMLAATHAFHGQGTLGGKLTLDATGNSFADLMGHGDGGFNLVLSGGGNLSALLINIAGLEFGQAFLSALGVPTRTNLNCFLADLTLRRGIASTNVFLLDTDEARTVGKGDLDFRNQTIDYQVTTRSTHFSIGSLPGPVDISGKIKSPSIRPGAEIVARAGAAVGLGVVFAPLGLLPTIQFGVGNDNACTKAFAVERASVAARPQPVVHRPR